MINIMPDQKWQPRRKWRQFPYYKVQVFREKTQTWQDERGAFDTVEEAKAHIAEKLGSASTRIMVVEDRRKRHVLE